MNLFCPFTGINAKFPSLSKWFKEISKKTSLREVADQYAPLADMKSILSGKTDGELVMVEFYIKVSVRVCLCFCALVEQNNCMLECNGDTIYRRMKTCSHQLKKQRLPRRVGCKEQVTSPKGEKGSIQCTLIVCS